ncbi:hypothetical protein GW17_00040952 [Ensete ventricosum]|nr:hypothetical protein GW17_00040952 [Ensete ventricosum]
MEKWEGKASAKLPTTKADEAWSLLSNFCSLHLWLPGLVETCRKIAGAEGQPGCVRYCTSPPGDDGKPVIWAYEELLAFDPARRCFEYKVADNNIGLKRYVATFRVLLPPSNGEGGCRLEWSFHCDPVSGWTEDSLAAFLQTGIEAMAKKVAETLHVTAAADGQPLDMI